MNSNKNNSDNQDHLNILRTISKKPKISQRKMANQLGFSLGKLNYCLVELKKKGLVKISNFSKNPNKLVYAYILTPKGISLKTKISHKFKKKKMKKYDDLKSEIEEN